MPQSIRSRRAEWSARRSTRLPAILSALLVVGTACAAHGAELIRARCHMDYCGWFSIENRDVVGTSATGALIKTTEKSWSSHHPNGYDRPAKRTGGGTSTGYYLCSKTKPAIVEQVEGKWQVEPIQPDQTYGATESATIAYYYVCHGVVGAGDDDFIRFARQFGYKPGTQADAEQYTVAQPLDVLRPGAR